MRKLLPVAAAALLSSVFAIPAFAQDASQQPLVKQPEAGTAAKNDEASKQQDATQDQAEGATDQKKQSNTAGAEQPKQDGSNDAATADQSQDKAEDAATVKPKESDSKNAASDSEDQNSNASKKADSTSDEPKDQDAAQTQQDDGGTAAESKQDRVNAAKSDSQDNATDSAAQANDDQDVSKETTASVNITAEQRTEIHKVIVQDAPPPVDLDINVSVGVEVAHTVELRPLPPRVIEIVPQYRGYRFFVLADGRIIIVQPKTYKVVYVLTA